MAHKTKKDIEREKRFIARYHMNLIRSEIQETGREPELSKIERIMEERKDKTRSKKSSYRIFQLLPRQN